MDRINHVKLVTPDPEAVRRFLTEVLELPPGWEFPGERPPSRHAPVPGGPLSWASVIERRGDDASGGAIVGSTESRQVQILRGPKAHVWAIAIATRHLERAYERCRERGIPCSEVQAVDWTERDRVRAFFAEVGGITFEVMRVEAREA